LLSLGQRGDVPNGKYVAAFHELEGIGDVELGQLVEPLQRVDTGVGAPRGGYYLDAVLTLG
jgi:hypothetical protein